MSWSAHDRLTRPADQNKIKLAISLRRIDPADIPASARVTAPPPSNNPTQRKRSAAQAGLQQSSQTHMQSMPGSSQRNTQESIEEEVQEEDARDELYCSLKTNVVGIQYYKGMSP